MTAGPPTSKATKAKRSGKCGHHPRYAGQNPPRTACPICWQMYLKAKYDMTPESVSVPAVITLSDDLDVQKFIVGLKNAVLRSRETGGCYSSFVHARDGTPLQIEVQLPITHERGTK